ncbi:MAG: MmgE/PrpD family protein [Bradyrhizobium sp.]
MTAVRLTEQLGSFVSALKANNTPPLARRRAIEGFIDCFGVMTAGADEPAAQVVRRLASREDGDSGTWPDALLTSSCAAALVNGTAAHALDYDDTGLKGHPSAVLVPAILATAEEIGASGASMVTAYLAGYETWAELIFREQDQHPTKGWHITGIFGAIAAAAACASIRELDAASTVTALSIAASQSSGLLANFGTMVKPLHAGLAARAGVFSAELAAAGLSASPDAFEHPQGFLAAVSPAGRFDITSPVRAGREWRMLSIGLNVKKYPMCYCTHRPIDGALNLRAKQSINARDIDSIVVSMSARNATILRHHAPKTVLEAKFSIEFAMAAAFIAGAVGIREVADGFVQRPDVQEFFRRVSAGNVVASDPVTGHGVYDKVDVRLANGKIISSGEVEVARGAASLPISDEETFLKFEDCLAASKYQLHAKKLFAMLSDLDGLDLVRDLYADSDIVT